MKIEDRNEHLDLLSRFGDDKVKNSPTEESFLGEVSTISRAMNHVAIMASSNEVVEAAIVMLAASVIFTAMEVRGATLETFIDAISKIAQRAAERAKADPRVGESIARIKAKKYGEAV